MMAEREDKEEKISFRTEFDPLHGIAVPLGENILRVTCNNAGPFTFHGTNSYILGSKSVAVIDPGPMDESHLQALLNAINGRDVSHIIVTHTHVDHSPLARKLAQITGAPILAEGPHRAARDLHLGEANPLDASADREFEPDRTVSHGEMIDGDGWRLEAVFTPGHTENHMSFALAGEDLLFSGDHVMAWATSIVAPPDGSMQNYMASLQTLLDRNESRYLPGHGGQLNNAREFVRALRTHRKMRETAILSRIKAGDRTIPEIVRIIYKDTDPRLHGAAALSVLAHVEDLLEKGVIASDGPASLEGEYLANA
ncbi:MAG: MBL fold metallo-hydrolase [Nitratireductor sp.]